MTNEFNAIVSELNGELDGLVELGALNSSAEISPKARLAAANAAFLLLSAVFEQFVREIAQSFARQTVVVTNSVTPRLREAAWAALARAGRRKIRFSEHGADLSLITAREEVNSLIAVCSGDCQQEVYEKIIVNDNNMRPDEISKIFKIVGISKVWDKVVDTGVLVDFTREVNRSADINDVRNRLEEIIDRRNNITHSIANRSSLGPSQLELDIRFLRALCDGISQVALREINHVQSR